jgi:hypothetical protein
LPDLDPRDLGRLLASGVGYLAGPAVVGESLADTPAVPLVRVVAKGLQSLDHRRDSNSGRAVRHGVDHVGTNPGIWILDQLEQPGPHSVVVSPDVAGAEVLASELPSPAVLAPGKR